MSSFNETKMIGTLMTELKKEHSNMNLVYPAPIPTSKELMEDRSGEIKNFEELGFAI